MHESFLRTVRYVLAFAYIYCIRLGTSGRLNSVMFESNTPRAACMRMCVCVWGGGGGGWGLVQDRKSIQKFQVKCGYGAIVLRPYRNTRRLYMYRNCTHIAPVHALRTGAEGLHNCTIKLELQEDAVQSLQFMRNKTVYSPCDSFFLLATP